ncbi:hypothetical protein B0H19DRAFT_1384612 [Mycena capillaripes]|nr:hypothetical protein B0H19DRAFT_1384612 [Mycena capillaripes]
MRRCFAERDASKLEHEGKASSTTTRPSSPRRCFAERDARPLGRRDALGAGGSREPASMSGPGSRAEDAALNPDFEYDLFLSFCANPVNPELDEAITSDGLLERVCDRLKGDIVRADVSTSSLLPLYLDGRDPLRGDDPARDLEALHPRYFLRSAVRRHKDRGDFAPNSGAKSTAAPLFPTSASPAKRGNEGGISPTPALPAKRGVKRPRPRDSSTPAAKREKRWLDDAGALRCPNGHWSYRTPTTADEPLVHDCPPPSLSEPAKRKRRRTSRGSKTTRGKVSTAHRIERLVVRSDFMAAGSFSLSADASFATTGWEGVAPPVRPRQEIQALYASQPRARGLYPWLCYFFPAEYETKPKDGLIFMYRSYRASWLMTPEARREFEYAHDLLVGKSAQSRTLQQKWSEAQRGEHLPIILGHYRQSSKRPTYTKYHTEHMKEATELINLPIIQRIIKFISDLVELVFPGVAARFKADAAWHKARYDIEPLFGLFWNLCLNARFRGQRRIHCKPHADAKNTIGICALLIFILSDGGKYLLLFALRKLTLALDKFNDTQRTWLVIWEAGVAIQLPPWTAALYPSAILYHFNVDVDEIEFVTVDGTARPTRENSRPIVDGDDCGRGSLVFFNESTMRHGPATGFHTLLQAKSNGFSGKIDPKMSLQEAFERYITFVPITPDLVQ